MNTKKIAESIKPPFIHIRGYFCTNTEMLPHIDMYLTEAQKTQWDRYCSDSAYRSKHYAPAFFKKAVLAAGYKIDESGHLYFVRPHNQ